MKKTRKILSITMALLMLFSVLCFTVSASSLEGVLVEDVTLREENVKHFKSPDGSYTAIVYSSPVHRKDDFGNWQDIDNRMSSTATLSTKAYSTDDGRVTFSKRVTDDSDFIFELSEDGYSIKMSIANNGINTASADLSNHTAKYTPVLSDSLSTQFSRVKQIDNSTTVTYESLMRGVDLEYTLTANDIKENIVISREQNEYVYSFTYELEGLDAELLDNGSVVLADEITGKPVYRIPAPYMYDADGTRSEAVEYTLNELKDGLYGLTVSADASWINADEREFPVYIDPTLSNFSELYVTYIDSNYEYQNFSYTTDLHVSSTQIAMIKSDGLPILPTNAHVTKATFYSDYYYSHSSYSGSGRVTISLHKISGFWTNYDITWGDIYLNPAPTVEIDNDSQNTISLSVSATSQQTTRTMPLDVTGMIRDWYNAKANNSNFDEYGFAFMYDDGTADKVILKASTEPYYVISYIVPELNFEEGIAHSFLNIDTNKLMKPYNSDVYSSVVVDTYSQYSTSSLWMLELYISDDLNSGVYYTIKNMNTDFYLTASNSAAVTMGYFDPTYSLWAIQKTDDNYYILQSKNYAENTISSNRYLAVSNGTLTQGVAISYFKWEVRPLTLRVNVLYDQGFIDRYGVNEYLNVLDNTFSTNSVGNSFSSFFKERFGVSVKLTIPPTTYQSLPHAEGCIHSNSINTKCYDCKNESGYEGVNKKFYDCQNGYHHKSMNKILEQLSPIPLVNSQNINVLFTGHVACSYDTTYEIHKETFSSGCSRTGENAVVIFTSEMEFNIKERQSYDNMIAVLTHEVLHNLGVDHCAPRCIMKEPSEEDEKNLHLCTVCTNTVNSNKFRLYNHS